MLMQINKYLSNRSRIAAHLGSFHDVHNHFLDRSKLLKLKKQKEDINMREIRTNAQIDRNLHSCETVSIPPMRHRG